MLLNNASALLTFDVLLCPAQRTPLSKHHGTTGVTTDATALLEQQLAAKDAQIAKLAGTLQHYRNWAMQVC